jgi:hypothetical protein
MGQGKYVKTGKPDNRKARRLEDWKVWFSGPLAFRLSEFPCPIFISRQLKEVIKCSLNSIKTAARGAS